MLQRGSTVKRFIKFITDEVQMAITDEGEVVG